MVIIIFRYDITIQDIKLANSLWTNEGLYTGRILRIPVIDPGTNFVTIYLSISISLSNYQSIHLSTLTIYLYECYKVMYISRSH